MKTTTFGKRLLSMVLIMAMLLGLMPGSVFASPGATEPDTTVVESTTTEPEEPPVVESTTEDEILENTPPDANQ